MILSRQAFIYNGKRLIEKVVFKASLRHNITLHDEGCLIFFKNASIRFFSSEENRQVNKHEAVLLRCGIYFMDFINNENADQIEVIVIHLYPDILKKLYINKLPSIIKKRSYLHKKSTISSHYIIKNYIKSLEFYFRHPTLINEDLLESKFKELILLLLQTENVDSILELITNLYSSKIESLKKVIECHLYSNLNVEELAKLCQMSLSSFKREFYKEYNDTPNNYLLSKKMEKAKELLIITEISIHEIAFKIGFNDPLYFTRIFKKKIGVTPTNYRKN